MLFSICSQTENVYDPRVSLLNLWGQVMTLRGQFLVSRTGDDTLRVLCCVLFVVCVVGVQSVGVGVCVGVCVGVGVGLCVGVCVCVGVGVGLSR